MKENNKNLAGENGEITNEQIVQLEKQLKEEKDLVSKIQSSKEDLEKKIKELEEKYKDIESKYIEGQSNTTSTVPTPPAIPGAIPPPPPPHPAPPGVPGAIPTPLVYHHRLVFLYHQVYHHLLAYLHPQVYHHLLEYHFLLVYRVYLVLLCL